SAVLRNPAWVHFFRLRPLEQGQRHLSIQEAVGCRACPAPLAPLGSKPVGTGAAHVGESRDAFGNRHLATTACRRDQPHRSDHQPELAMVSVKRLLKAPAQQLAGTVAPFLWRWRAPSLVVMMYHRVLPHTHPDRATEQPGMYVSPETFELHMHLLRKHFGLVHLDDWLDALAENRPLPRHACAVTFDDGWRDNYQYAFPVLERLGVPATVYLVSDLVGSSYSFWPNALAK